MTGERIRQAELARRLEVSRQAVNDLVARGILTVGPDGLIDIDAARQAIAANLHPTAKSAASTRPEAPPAEKPRPIDFNTARTLREYTESQRVALKLRQETGELAPLAEIEQQLRLAVLSAREYLRGEPPRLALLLDGLDRPAREALLAHSFDEFLRRLASWRDVKAPDG